MTDFESSIIDVIKKRSSWRSYSPVEIEEDKKAKLLEYIDCVGESPFDHKASFSMFKAAAPQKGKVKGTYGVIAGAHEFIGGSVEKGKSSFETYGYLFEHIILFATSLGLGTCWMGGTFDRSSFAKKVGLEKGFILPAVSPVGVCLDKRNRTDTIIRFMAGSKKRKPWDKLFYKNDFNTPLSESEAGEFKTPVEMVRVGPSASNKQPWRIIMKDGSFHFFLQRTKDYGKMVGISELQRVDMGIAMCHFELTANELGLPGEWEFDEPDCGELPELTSYLISWKV
jgi:nitroreductase